MLRCPENFVLVEDTVGSCSCSPSVLRNSGSIFKVFSSEKELIPIKFFGSTLEYWHRKISALGLICLIRPVMVSSSSSDTKSVLLRSIRSAKATCSAASFSTPSGFSSSSRVRMCFASVTVMIPSSTNFSRMSSSTKNVCATGAGSAKPVVSMMTASNCAIFE